jgi:adenylate cyclase
VSEHRRLAAIVALDLVGFSRLIGVDEVGTLAALRARRNGLVDPQIAAHEGRIVKTMGDGLLLEFSSAVHAVLCAVEIQKGMSRSNTDLPADRRLLYRIGIHVGDVVVEGDDIFGNGVNIAARLEPLAEPGGIVLSQRVFEEVRDRLPLAFSDGGARALKNIARTVRVWRWIGAQPGIPLPPVGPALALPDKPSIAVLPFANMSGDLEQEYFADGIAEDLITELSRFRELFVIARNSSFVFKGRSVDVTDIGRRLGVRYVVEGSVRRTGDHARVTAQLVDATTGRHVWAERYDRHIEDVFVAQDEITAAVVAAIAPAVSDLERERARRTPPESLSAWETYQRGLWHVYQYTAEDNTRAIALFARALELDSHFATAHAGLAYAFYISAIWGFTTDERTAVKQAKQAAEAAVALDNRDAFARATLGRVLMVSGSVREATSQCESAIALNPNLASAHYGLGFALTLAGRHVGSLASVDRAIRLSPYDPLMHAFLTLRSGTLVNLGRFEEAVDVAREAQRQPNATLWAHLHEATALVHLARPDEARAAASRALAVKPDLSMRYVRTMLPHLPEADFGDYLEGMRRAGLPD